MAQVLTISILTRWGHSGFFAHSERVSAFYKQKRDVFEAALRKHLTGLVEWNTPESGIFIWCVPFTILHEPRTLQAPSRHANENVIVWVVFRVG